MVNRSLPAVTTSLGILATPVIGVISSAIVFGEPISLSLVVAMALILTGIAVGAVPRTVTITLRRGGISNERLAQARE